ncbi:MAG: sulfotransferase [Sphingomonadales bacterium]|nr:sulfotransferase [Sphingomonadales bacterium]
MLNPILQLAADGFRRAARSDHRAALVRSAKTLIDQKAVLANEWLDISRHLVRWGEIGMALAALDLWEAQGAPPFEPQNERAIVLARAGRSHDAYIAANAMPADQPSVFANSYLKGSIATNLGDPETAEREFRRTIRALPDSARAWLGIAQLGRISKRDEEQLGRLLAREDRLEMTDRAALQNALGIVLHGQRAYAEAFDHFSRCTEILQESFRYQPVDNEQSAQTVLQWDLSAIERLSARAPVDARRPVFVTGLPRSGTTLVEQIVSAHSRVDGGGELGLALQLEATADGFAPEDIERVLARRGGRDELRDLYLRLVAERIPGAGMFVDKSLNQSRSLGPLSVLFPDAPIIWMRRDPLDNAWSIYRSWLANNVVGGWSLTDIAHHMAIEDRLLAHWQGVLGDRVLALSYGDLVENPETWVERISQHCGLDLEPMQLTPHLSSSAVTTASAQQVRQPINRMGLGVAEPYRAFLAPFIDAYPGPQATVSGARPERVPPRKLVDACAAAPTADPALRSKTPREILVLLKQALARRERATINSLIATLVESKAELGSQWRALTNVLQHNGEHSLALRAAELWTAQSGDSAEARFTLVSVMAMAGKVSDAAGVLESLPDDFPDALGNAYTKGTIAINSGKIDAAREHLRRAVGIAPQSGQAWLALAMTGKLEADDCAALIDADDAMALAPPIERAAWHYAKSRVRDQEKSRQEAIAAVREGGAIMAQQRPYRPLEDRGDANRGREGWTAATIKQVQSTITHASPRPIFVTGLPRSGTTLVEQILASHSAVDGGEELGLFRQVMAEMKGKSHADFEEYESAGGNADELVDLYNYLLAERFPGEGKVVDKTLDASRHMGLLAALLPDAPIVWLHRDPLDCAWSAYRTWFLSGIDWSWRLQDIAMHFKLEDQLHRYWKAELGARILDVPYAELVTDSEHWIEKITEHCGLRVEPQQFKAHEIERAVTTASVAQVREPINRKGVGSSAPYAPWLKPFSDAYGIDR